MEIIRVRAELAFHGKTRAVLPGFRPTLSFAGRKVLCNIQDIDPMPLHPHERGVATIAVAWDWPQQCDIGVGSRFSALEGEKVVGEGSVIQLI